MIVKRGQLKDHADSEKKSEKRLRQSQRRLKGLNED